VARRRIDSLLAERGLVPSRARGAEEVRAGRVRIGHGGARAEKPSQLVPDDAELRLEPARRYVSRGGLKLERALDELEISVAGRDCLDVGASTGGFTDCLLSRGARRVIALDVGHGQLDWLLRRDDRVIVVERTNARDLRPELLPFRPEFATIDISFISLTKVLEPAAACLRPGGEVLALVKPQFELRPAQVGKGGVVRNPGARRTAILSVADAAERLGLRVRGLASSGLPGPKGNRESFLWLAFSGPGVAELEAEARRVEPDEGAA
jgi:23S rRNA (cytidine1920-2'-O)/16S rRNA (cytidine1409-2'-O)-methyltransferase